MANYIALLIPVFLLLIGIEWWYSYQREDRRYHGPNTALNMAVGAIDQLGALLYMLLLYVAMDYSKQHFQMVEMSLDWRQWLLAFFAVDFTSYWYHRCSHRVNFLWAGHVTHHSSSYFNLSNGFRTSPFQGLFRIPFWMLMPIVGFDPLLLLVTFKVVGLHDFFVHTPYVAKLGWLEKVIVTPSHHRVHHGKNDLYIDKNYGSFLIIWDKMFGTFQEETETVEYGITSAYTDDSPVHAITYYFKILAKQWSLTPGLWNKVRVWFMPPGWRAEIQGMAFRKTPLREVNPLSKKQKNYAIWLLAVGVCGFVLTLFAYRLYAVFLVGYTFLFSVSSIVQGALLLNHGFTNDIRFWEKFRLFVLLLFVVFIVDLHWVIGLLILLCLLLSGFMCWKWTSPGESQTWGDLREIAKNPYTHYGLSQRRKG